MHECWNHGKMDSWVKVHTQPKWEGPKGALTMGYYSRAQLPFHWALADHFTLGDAYHCSILGPTHPNRLMANSGTIDPSGKHGGPVVATNSSPTNGQWFVSMVLRELTSNPKVWSKTALFIMYDENDGWFDHVTPPTAPKGTSGEYLTTRTFPQGEKHPDTLGFKGPLGLGVR